MEEKKGTPLERKRSSSIFYVDTEDETEETEVKETPKAEEPDEDKVPEYADGDYNE